MIRQAREEGVPLTIETTHHYLSLLAEDVPDGATQFKCCPPVRDTKNQASTVDICVTSHEASNTIDTSLRSLPSSPFVG